MTAELYEMIQAQREAAEREQYLRERPWERQGIVVAGTNPNVPILQAQAEAEARRNNPRMGGLFGPDTEREIEGDFRASIGAPPLPPMPQSPTAMSVPDKYLSVANVGLVRVPTVAGQQPEVVFPVPPKPIPAEKPIKPPPEIQDALSALEREWVKAMHGDTPNLKKANEIAGTIQQTRLKWAAPQPAGTNVSSVNLAPIASPSALAPRSSIPPAAIQLLRERPELWREFDAKYGPNASSSYLP